MMDFSGMSREQIEAVVTAAQAELERRTHVWELRERFDWQVREFERLAAVQGPVPASPVPEGGFMPGQVVDADGVLYLNGSGGFVDYAPGDEPLSEWVHVETPPEPGEPEEPPAEPEPETPDYPEWEQPRAGEEYEPDAHVIFEGHVWRNDLGSPNGFPPDAPHSGWTDLGPVS